MEIWQVNAAGRYVHLRDQRDAPLDPDFTGVGRVIIDTDDVTHSSWYGRGSIPGATTTMRGARRISNCRCLGGRLRWVGQGQTSTCAVAADTGRETGQAARRTDGRNLHGALGRRRWRLLRQRRPQPARRLGFDRAAGRLASATGPARQAGRRRLHRRAHQKADAVIAGMTKETRAMRTRASAVAATPLALTACGRGPGDAARTAMEAGRGQTTKGG